MCVCVFYTINPIQTVTLMELLKHCWWRCLSLAVSLPRLSLERPQLCYILTPVGNMR